MESALVVLREQRAALSSRDKSLRQACMYVSGVSGGPQGELGSPFIVTTGCSSLPAEIDAVSAG